MDDLGFDRLVKGLAASSGRRQAVLATLGGVLAAVTAGSDDNAEAKGKKKKRKKQKNNTPPVVPPPPPPPPCTNLTGACSAASQCCGASAGDATCRAHVKAACQAQFPGQRCCALEGELCNPNNGDCECCDDLVCGVAGDGKFRCESAEI